MPLIRLEEVEPEYVTPKYSTAFGEVITGEELELARLSFDAAEGAVEHAHEHEQIMYVLSGRLRVELPDDSGEIGPGEAFHARPNEPHKVTALEDTVVISCKNLVEGVGHKITPGEYDRLDQLGKDHG